MPSNTGRGYVLRRILRRAARYGREMLGARDGLLAALVPAVVASLGDAYPELRARQAAVQAVLAEEERAFGSMLTRGLKEFGARTAAARAAGAAELSGADAFFLHDSMGFPLDLTQLMAREAGLAVGPRPSRRSPVLCVPPGPAPRPTHARPAGPSSCAQAGRVPPRGRGARSLRAAPSPRAPAPAQPARTQPRRRT